jgi:hypothetical protein
MFDVAGADDAACRLCRVNATTTNSMHPVAHRARAPRAPTPPRPAPAAARPRSRRRPPAPAAAAAGRRPRSAAGGTARGAGRAWRGARNGLKSPRRRRRIRGPRGPCACPAGRPCCAPAPRRCCCCWRRRTLLGVGWGGVGGAQVTIGKEARCRQHAATGLSAACAARVNICPQSHAPGSFLTRSALVCCCSTAPSLDRRRCRLFSRDSDSVPCFALRPRLAPPRSSDSCVARPAPLRPARGRRSFSWRCSCHTRDSVSGSVPSAIAAGVLLLLRGAVVDVVPKRSGVPWWGLRSCS